MNRDPLTYRYPTKGKLCTDNLMAWHKERDPLRYRQGLSSVQYATSTQRFDRLARRIPERALDWLLGCVIGATLALLLFNYL